MNIYFKHTGPRGELEPFQLLSIRGKFAVLYHPVFVGDDKTHEINWHDFHKYFNVSKEDMEDIANAYAGNDLEALTYYSVVYCK